MAAYQKKSAASIDFSLPSSSIPEVSTPPPVVPEPATSTETITDAITQAADTAMDAAQSASAAADSISSSASEAAKTVAAPLSSALFTKTSTTKAAVAASASSASTTAPSLLEFVKERKYEETSIGLDDAREKISILKANILGDAETWKAASEKVSAGLGGMTTATKSMAAKSAALAGSASAAAGSQAGNLNFDGLKELKMDNANFDSDVLTNIAANLHLDQYGPWYVSAGVILLTLNAKEQSIAATERKFELELKEARGKAEEAADAASVAAEGAKLAKELVAKIPVESRGSNGADLLENSRVRQLEVEKVSYSEA